MGKRAAKLKAKNLVFSDLLCLPDGRILALERDNRGQDGSTDPKKAIFKSVCVLDLSGATDLLFGQATGSHSPNGTGLETDPGQNTELIMRYFHCAVLCVSIDLNER